MKTQKPFFFILSKDNLNCDAATCSVSKKVEPSLSGSKPKSGFKTDAPSVVHYKRRATTPLTYVTSSVQTPSNNLSKSNLPPISQGN